MTTIATTLTAGELKQRLFTRSTKFTPETTEPLALANRMYHDENATEGQIARLLTTLEQQRRMVAGVTSDDGYEAWQRWNLDEGDLY